MWKDKKSGLKLGFLKKFPKKSRKILFYLFFIFWKNFKTEKQSYIHLWLFILIFQITILSLDYITYEISENMQNNQIVSIN